MVNKFYCGTVFSGWSSFPRSAVLALEYTCKLPEQLWLVVFPVSEPGTMTLDANLGSDPCVTPFALARFRHLALLWITDQTMDSREVKKRPGGMMEHNQGTAA